MGYSSRAFSVNKNDYQLLEEIGYGATATVYRAVYLPNNFIVAVKSLDLDRCNSKLDDIRREAQTMSLIDHPNVVKAYCSFAVDHYLWVVMPFMAQGSCLHLMKIAYQEGFEEATIASILKETLKALVYLHEQGHIHRDVKAGNILLDSNGEVKLADFGVSACMFDTGDRQRSRNTFVGTPCWMAPEVLQPGTGYDFKADIWSLGISALELAHGHAPFSKYPPIKVLLMTIQNAPPGLDYDRDKKFSKAFKEMVAMCLVKDQTKRPTAEKLLKHSFFKHAKPPQLTVKKLFADLPPLWNRVKSLQLKDAEQLALKKMPSSEEEALSQSEYQRGVSAWNFDIEDLKTQASLVQDDDDVPETLDEDEITESLFDDKDIYYSTSGLRKLNIANDAVQSNFCEQASSNEISEPDCLKRRGKAMESDILKSDYQEKIVREDIGSKNEVKIPLKGNYVAQLKNKTEALKDCQTQSGPQMPGIMLRHSSLETRCFSERSENENHPSERVDQARRVPNLSGPLMLPRRASGNSLSAPIKSSGGFRDSLDDKSKSNLVQIKGRFSVTSENLDLAKDIPSSAVQLRTSQGSPLRKSASVGDWILESKSLPPSQSVKELINSNIPTSILSVHLHNLLQQTSIQQDFIMDLLNSLQPAEAVDTTQNGKLSPVPGSIENNGTMEMASSEREHMLLTKISELQARMISLNDELTAEKLKQVQLQQQLSIISAQQENGRVEGSA